MLTIKLTPDYDAILRWNAGKDEAFLFQWAGTTAYRYPLTKEQLMRQSAKDGVTVFMAYENEVPIGTMELCRYRPCPKNGAHLPRTVRRGGERKRTCTQSAFRPLRKGLCRNGVGATFPACILLQSACHPLL